MTTADLISRCRASIADDKKHGLTYRTCRAEDFEALVELANLAIEAESVVRDETTSFTDDGRGRWLARYDYIVNDTPQ